MSQHPFSTARLGRARLGVGLIFLSNGAAFASLVPRLPEVKADLGLTNTQFGFAVAAFPAGALAAGLLAGVLIRRFGSNMVAWVGMIVSMGAILGAAAAPSLPVFAGSIFIAGCLDALTDVAQNHHALRVQKLLRRSIINSYHAMWSVGALIGGSLGAAMIGLHVDRLVHLAIAAVLILAVSTLGWRMMLPGPEPSETTEAQGDGSGKPRWQHPMLVLAALSVLALVGAAIEENAGTWATVYLRENLGVTGPLAVSGYLAGMATHFLGRVTGDALVNRLGQRRMALLGGALAALGMGLAVAVPTAPLTVLGYACAGFGVATVIPSVFEAADALPGLKPGTGVTVTSFVLRLGFLGSPPLVGMIADATSLRWGLLVVAAAGLVTMALAWSLSGRRTPPDAGVPATR